MHYHTTKEGHRLALVQIGDSHLLNILRLFIRMLNEARASLEAPKLESPFLKALYANDFNQHNEAREEMVRELYRKLPPYWMEASIRGLVTPTLLKELQTAVGRSEGLGAPEGRLEPYREDLEDEFDPDELRLEQEMESFRSSGSSVLD